MPDAERIAQSFLVWASILFLGAISVGTWLRGTLALGWPLPTPFANALHAHSHSAYFGWGGLGLMGAIYRLLPKLTGRPLVVTKVLRLHAWVGPLVASASLISFLLWGYTAPSIAVSVLNQFSWYLFAAILWRHLKPIPKPQWQFSLIMLVGASLPLLISTLGSWILALGVAVSANAGAWRTIGLNLFLHAYGDGWLIMGAMALVALQLPAAGQLRLSPSVAWRLVVLQVLGVAGFFLLPLPELSVPALTLIGQLGNLLMAAAEVWFVILVWPALHHRREPTGPPAAAGAAAAAPGLVKFAVFFLAAKAAADLTALFPQWTQWAGNRQLMLAHLHLKLLGVFSAALISWLLGFLPARHRANSRWAQIFVLGVAGMVAALIGGGLYSPSQAWGHGWYVAAMIAAWLTFAGGGIVAGTWLARRRPVA